MALRKVNSFAVKNRSLTVLRLGTPEAQPNLASDVIVQTVQLNDGIDIDTVCKSATLSNATSATLYTTSTDTKKRFFIDSVSLAASRDDTGSASLITVTATIAGTATIILPVRLANAGVTVTATAQNNSILLNPRSIPVDAGTNITITADNATATIAATASIVGHYEYFN